VSYEIINAGVIGWGTAQELLFHRHEGYKYEPDLVLLMFYVGNDMQDNTIHLDVPQRRPYFTWSQVENSLGPLTYLGDPEPEEQDTFSIKGMLQASSAYWIAKSILMRSPVVAKLLIEKGIGIDFSYLYDIYLSDYSPELEEGWAVTLALLKQLRDEVEAQDAKLVVVLIPSIAQVDENMWELARDTYLPMGAEADPDKPDTILLNFLEEEGFSYLHLLPHFREQPAQLRESLYLYHDGHWDVEGHRLTSQLIYDYLTHEFWPSQVR
jgi:hypothetical protein